MSALAAPRHRGLALWRERLPLALAVLAVVAGEAVVLLGVDVPVLRPLVGAAVLAGVPAVVLTTRTAGPPAAARAAYALGATVLGIILATLLLDLALPWVGVDQPLRPRWLVPVSTAADVALLLWRRDRAPGLRRFLRARPDGLTMLAVLALGVTVVGAIRLNNGAGNAVALAALGLVALVLGLLFLDRRDDLGLDARIVYIASLALLFGTSLRGWYTTGHDIQKEYVVFRLTFQAGRWDMGLMHDPYNACLSLNLLPDAVANFTGIHGPLLGKTEPNLIFAAVPVVLYLLGRRVTSRGLALLGTLVMVTFPGFSSDMPYMARQEVAYLFLGLLFLAGTERAWSVRQRQVHVALAGIGVVLSHYSTGYLLVITLGIAWALWLVVLAWRRLRGSPGAFPRASMAATLPLALVTAAAVLWVGPATHTAGHLAKVLTDTAEGITGSSKPLVSADLGKTILPVSVESPQQRLDDFSREQLEAGAADRAAGELLPVDREQAYPRVAPDETAPPTALGRLLGRSGLAPATLNALAQSVCGKAVQGSMLIGLVLLLRRRWRRGRFSLEYRILCLATVCVLGMVAVLPGVSVEYGIFRAFQQALLVLAPVVAMGLWAVVGQLRRLRRFAVPALAVLFAGFFATMTSASGALLGAGQPQIRLFNSGDYYRTYYVVGPEAAAARFVASQHPDAVTVDGYTHSRLVTFLGDVPVLEDGAYPSLLRKDGVQLFGPETVIQGWSITSIAGGDRLTYVYPLDLVEQHRDLVYDNGSAEVFSSGEH